MAVEKIKNNDRFRSEYAAMNLHDRDIQRVTRREALAEGMEKGQRKKALETAENFLREGDSPEKVARCTGLSLEKVLVISEKLRTETVTSLT